MKSDIGLICQLLKEKKYFELQELYHKTVYRSFLSMIMGYMKKNDILSEKVKDHSFNSSLFFENLKRRSKMFFASCGLATLLAHFGFDCYLTYEMNHDRENFVEYYYGKDINLKFEELKKQYDKDVLDYVEVINSLGQDDLGIFVQVMNDMYQSIYGYQTPDFYYDNHGYYRYNLYLYNFGVCRQFADDYAARINAISDNYHAIPINVYCKNAEPNDIERYILESNDYVNPAANEMPSFLFHYVQRLVGNHMVVMVSFKDRDYSLVIDPTNPSIGVLDNGQIYMLNQEATNQFMSFPEIISTGKEENFRNYWQSFFQSFMNHTNPSELLNEYGVERQNEVLKDIETISSYRTYETSVLRDRLVDYSCGYETFTIDDILAINSSKYCDPSSLSESFYHAINLRIKHDLEIRRIEFFGFPEDIDVLKINFPEDKIIIYNNGKSRKK